jgi:hypothetical protein
MYGYYRCGQLEFKPLTGRLIVNVAKYPGLIAGVEGPSFGDTKLKMPLILFH